MCRIIVFLRPPSGSSSPEGCPEPGPLFLCPKCLVKTLECDHCGGMAWTMRSRARWEELLNIQKRRLGKHLSHFDAKLSFDNFDIYLKDLEASRAQRGLGRLLQPNVLEQIKEFTGVVNTLSQTDHITLFLWGAIQVILKVGCSPKLSTTTVFVNFLRIACTFVDTMATIAEMLTDLTQQLPLFEQYRSLFPTAYELDEPLRELYFNYVGFCIDTVIFLKSKRWKVIIRLSLGSLRKDFEKIQVNISTSASRFHTQVDIARTRLGVRAHEHIINLTEANLRRQAVVNGIPFHRNFRFQGRDTVLDDLHRILRPTTGKPGQTSCVIHGIGGVGKTQVALEYTYRYRENYSYIFWVRGEDAVQISTSFASFRRSLMPNIEVQDQLANVSLVRDWMVQNDRWLLVFDNVDAPDIDLSLFWPPSSHGEIIVTTQRRDFSHWAANDIHLDTFNEDDGARMILNIVDSSTHTHSEQITQIARNISTELGGLPLLISHIAGYVDGTKAPLGNILKNLQQPSEFKRIWAFDSKTSTNFQYKESMTKVWGLALNTLKPEALRTLRIMAMLSPDEVNEDLLFGDWQDAELAFLSEQRRFEFNDLRRSLINRHLVTVTTGTTSTKLSMHRVLKKHILQQIDDEGDEELCLVFKRAVAMVRRKFPKADELQTPNSAISVECEQCLPHILSLLAIYRDWSPKAKPTFDFATLLADTATNYMWERGLTAEAIDILKTGECVCNELSQMEEIRPVYADICAIAGSVHETIGLSGRAAALRECEKALKLRQEKVEILETRGQVLTAHEVLPLANAWNDVGVVKLSYGDSEAALPYFVESQRLKQLHKAEQDIPWHYGELCKNLALVKLYQGDMAGAEDNARRSCKLCCFSRSEKDASTQKARSILGIVLMNVGKTDEAFDLLKGVYNVRREILGETNLHTRNSLYLVAELYRLKGKMEKAESSLRLALHQCEFSWSDESVARAKYHLALVIQSTPDKLNAERELEAKALIGQARETRNRVAQFCNDALLLDDELQSYDFMVSLLAGRWIKKMK